MALNLTDVLRRAKLADAAYPSRGSPDPWGEIELRVKELGYFDFTHFDRSGTQAFVCANENEVCYGYRGSDDLADWVKNLKFVRRAAVTGHRGRCVGRVHRGFMNAYSAVTDSISAAVRKRLRENPARTLHGVGHSLGAACAALTAFLELAELRPKLTLFGTPRIGNRRFAREFNFILGDRTIALRNHNDGVTLSPFWNHCVGRQWYLTGDGELLDHPGPFYRFLQQLKANVAWGVNAALLWASGGRFGRPLSWTEQVTDHFMASYVAEVERALRKQQGKTEPTETGGPVAA